MFKDLPEIISELFTLKELLHTHVTLVIVLYTKRIKREHMRKCIMPEKNIFVIFLTRFFTKKNPVENTQHEFMPVALVLMHLL